MIAKDFEPDLLAEVMYHDGGRFMGSSQNLPIRESAAATVPLPGEPGIRLNKLLQDPLFSIRAVAVPGYALPEWANLPERVSLSVGGQCNLIAIGRYSATLSSRVSGCTSSWTEPGTPL